MQSILRSVTLQEVLQFFTGALRVPVGAFDHGATLSFSSTAYYPSTSICALYLHSIIITNPLLRRDASLHLKIRVVLQNHSIRYAQCFQKNYMYSSHLTRQYVHYYHMPCLEQPFYCSVANIPIIHN